MTIEEFTRHYVRAFKKGPRSSETRIAYENLKQYGDSLGITLTKTFFRKIMQKYEENPQELERSLEEINQAVLSQMRDYMQNVQETHEKLKPAKEKRQERSNVIEII